MIRMLVVCLLLMPALVVHAQAPGGVVPYTPAVPTSSSFNNYGYMGGHSSTLEEGAMRGMASVVSAKGDYNLATSAAAVNLTQAEKQDIENRQAATQAYFAMQETNRSARDAKRSPRLSQEQLVRIAAQSAPKQLTSNEVNPVSGAISWPILLTDPTFADDRKKVEQLLAKQATYGSLALSDHAAAGESIEHMSAQLREMIKSVPAQSYVTAKNFLKSLMYNLTRTTLL